MAAENVHAGHRERLRDEFAAHGAEAFSDVRSLELLLFYAIPRKDTNELAHALLNEFGSLYNVFSASVDELCRVDGIGRSTAVLIRLIPELSQKALREKLNSGQTVIRSTDAACELIRSHFGYESAERFVLFCLDNKNRVIKSEAVSTGVVNSVSVDVRKVAEIALSAKSAACIVAHNHPAGDCQPSPEDKAVTARLKDALAVLGIALIDHIIVGESKEFSFAAAGLL